jgi:hypothetical protein
MGFFVAQRTGRLVKLSIDSVLADEMLNLEPFRYLTHTSGSSPRLSTCPDSVLTQHCHFGHAAAYARCRFRVSYAYHVAYTRTPFCVRIV